MAVPEGEEGGQVMFEWEEQDRFSFEDSDRFEEVPLTTSFIIIAMFGCKLQQYFLVSEWLSHVCSSYSFIIWVT